jgi:hypothetical protein
VTVKIPKIVIYLIVIGLSLVIGVIIGYTPSESVNGFLSFLFIGIWISYTINLFIRIKKMREYRFTLNDGFLIFGILLISVLYAIWGDFTPILAEKLFPTTHLQLNFWIVIFSTPYLVFGTFLLLFSITRYFTVYFGEKAFNARKFTVLMGFLFLSIDLSVIIYFATQLHIINVQLIVHASIIVFFSILGIFTRNRSMSAYNLDRLTTRMSEIDRRINDADNASEAARRSEQRARVVESARQKRREREAQNRKDEVKKRNKELMRTKTTAKTSRSHSSNIQSSPTSNKELLKMRPKTAVLSKEDFMCIFCFELPNSTDRDGIVLCPHCQYPAHYNEFKEWVRNSKLCSRCDGVLSSSFIQNPKVIPVKTYLKAYKLFKKQF